MFKVVLLLESFEQCSPLFGWCERSKVYLSRVCYDSLVVGLKFSHQGLSLDSVRKPDLGTTMEITKLTFHGAIMNTICTDSKLSFAEYNLKHAKCTFKGFNLNHTKWNVLLVGPTWIVQCSNKGSTMNSALSTIYLSQYAKNVIFALSSIRTPRVRCCIVHECWIKVKLAIWFRALDCDNSLHFPSLVQTNVI